MDLIAVVDLADELQVRKQRLFKVMARLGIQAGSRRDSARGGQNVATVSPSEADALRAELSRAQPSGSTGRRRPAEDGAVYASEDIGVFYLIQLEPVHDPLRFKVGFTTELEGRLRKHRCSAPFAVPVKVWPCRRTWERAAMDCITAGCEQLHTEVFRGAALDDVARLAERFFSLMPSLATALDGESEADAPLEGGQE